MSRDGLDQSPSVLVTWPDGPHYVGAERVIGWARDSWADRQEGAEPTTLGLAVALLTDRGEVTFAGHQPDKIAAPEVWSQWE